jgi:hypothetical protein
VADAPVEITGRGAAVVGAPVEITGRRTAEAGGGAEITERGTATEWRGCALAGSVPGRCLRPGEITATRGATPGAPRGSPTGDGPGGWQRAVIPGRAPGEGGRAAVISDAPGAVACTRSVKISAPGPGACTRSVKISGPELAARPSEALPKGSGLHGEPAPEMGPVRWPGERPRLAILHRAAPATGSRCGLEPPLRTAGAARSAALSPATMAVELAEVPQPPLGHLIAPGHEPCLWGPWFGSGSHGMCARRGSHPCLADDARLSAPRR